MAQSVPAVDKLTETVEWMRRHGVVELSHEGLTLRLGELPASPISTPAADEVPADVLVGDARPPPAPGMCRVCGEREPEGIWRDHGMCRPCAAADFRGAA